MRSARTSSIAIVGLPAARAAGPAPPPAAHASHSPLRPTPASVAPHRSRATVIALTAAAPARRRALPASDSVAPVVTTSSTRTHPPARDMPRGRRGATANASATFTARCRSIQPELGSCRADPDQCAVPREPQVRGSDRGDQRGLVVAALPPPRLVHGDGHDQVASAPTRRQRSATASPRGRASRCSPAYLRAWSARLVFPRTERTTRAGAGDQVDPRQVPSGSRRAGSTARAPRAGIGRRSQRPRRRTRRTRVAGQGR